MAPPGTRFLTNDPLTRKRWSKDLFRVIMPAVEFNYLVGKGSDAAVQMNTDLGKGEGDEVTFRLRLPLQGEGVVGDATVEGTEEKMRSRNFKLTIEELNHSVDTGGKMEEQRVPYNLMQEAKEGLQEWWAGKLSDYVINSLCGNVNHKIGNTTTFGQAIDAPDPTHHFIVGGKTEATLTSADIPDLQYLDKLKQEAEVPTNGNYKIRKFGLSGDMDPSASAKGYYRVIMHNYAFEMLRQNTNLAQWGDLRRAAGAFKDPSIEIEYNGMLISKSERVPNILPSSVDPRAGVYRIVLLGPQAGVWAWGGAGDSKSTTMSFTPYTRDADRFMLVRGGGIWGMRKTRFENKDFAVITGSTWAAPLTA